MRAFASDNYAGVHPDVLAAITEANRDHAVSYGADAWTERAHAMLRETFGPGASPWLVFNGTAANVLALGAVCRPWEAVITPETSHLHVDEAGAPERMAGVKLLTPPGVDGKLTPDDVPPMLARAGDEHSPQARVVSVANATELGTIYTVAELRALADTAHSNGLLFHVDGARLANAAAALDASLADITTHIGADLASFGLTKVGAMGAEVVLFLGEEPAGFAWARKQQAQLASKMRFMAAQVIALLEDGLWRRLATHANDMATALAATVQDIPEVHITRAVQANAVFAVLPARVASTVRAQNPFYTWNEATGEVRWMCSWDTTERDVADFGKALRDATAALSA